MEAAVENVNAAVTAQAQEKHAEAEAVEAQTVEADAETKPNEETNHDEEKVTKHAKTEEVAAETGAVALHEDLTTL